MRQDDRSEPTKIECGALSGTVKRAERESAAREILRAGISIRIRNTVTPWIYVARANPNKTLHPRYTRQGRISISAVKTY